MHTQMESVHIQDYGGQDSADEQDIGAFIDGGWEEASDVCSLRVGDVGTLPESAESPNPTLVLQENLGGKVRKVDGDGDTFVYFPIGPYWNHGEHWVGRGKVKVWRPQQEEGDVQMKLATSSASSLVSKRQAKKHRERKCQS